MRARDVVTCFVMQQGRLLLLRRSARVATYPGLWAAVSGTMEAPDAAAEALREVREELGLAPPQVRVVRVGPVLEAEDAALGVRWRVHPVLAELAPGAEPRLDWEHDEARWVRPEDVGARPTVPRLADALREVLHGP